MQPKPTTSPQCGNPSFSDLILASEYYQHKANECRDLIESLTDWATIPNAMLAFSVKDRNVASFNIGPAENDFLQTVFMSLLAYYQRKAAEVKAEIETQKLTGTDSTTQGNDPGPNLSFDPL